MCIYLYPEHNLNI